MYEGSESVWHVHVYIFTPIPFKEFLNLRRSMPPLLQDATSTLEFMMPPIKLTWSLVRVIFNSWMEWNMLTFSNELVDLPTSMWSMYPIHGTSSSRRKWILPLCLLRNWSPPLRKCNFGKRSTRRLHLEAEAPLSPRRGNIFRWRDGRVHSHFTTSQDGDSWISSLRHSQQCWWLGVVALC
jgi:hypothetical protein